MKKKIQIQGITPLSIPIIFCCFLTLFSPKTHAQIGGDYTFAFLRQSPSARLTALGTSQIALRDNDLGLAYANPSLLDADDHNALIFNHNFLLGGVGTGSFGYGYHVEKWATTLQAHVQYMNYGNFQQADEFGNIQGTFRANEYAVTLGAGKKINERLAAGLNAKFITSQLEAYSASGIAFDLAGNYWHEEKKFGVSIIFKNIGTQLSTYTEGGQRQELPLDVQIGISKKLARAPFRFSALLHSLNRWNLRYTSPLNEVENLLGEAPQEPNGFSKAADNLFRHLAVGGELVLGKNENFRLRLGYNHQLRKELAVNNLRSLSGFSLGVGFKINRFRFDYGLGRQHVAGGVNHISLSTNLSEFKKK